MFFYNRINVTTSSSTVKLSMYVVRSIQTAPSYEQYGYVYCLRLQSGQFFLLSSYIFGKDQELDMQIPNK